MMRLIAIGLALLSAPATAQDGDIHSPWDQLLGSYLSDHRDGVNRFDYDGLRQSPESVAILEGYIRSLEAQTPSSFADDEAFAYWANLYNAVTVRLIVVEAPEDSIRQIRPRPWSIGPWGVERVVVEGEALSLDNIEHDIMRVRFQAALVHYAVNCASIGCPNLAPRAWRAEGLQGDLEAAAIAYINHPRGVNVTDRGLEISRIYKWFKEDFGNSDDGVIAHLLTYARPELAAQIEANPHIRGHAYDWALNQP